MAVKKLFPCRVRGRHIDWDVVDGLYVPNTSWPWIDYYNERCIECGVVVWRGINATGHLKSIYQASSYPEGYKWSAEDVPDAFEMFQLRKKMKRTSRRRKPVRRLESAA